MEGLPAWCSASGEPSHVRPGAGTAARAREFNALRGGCVSAYMLPLCGSQAHVARHMAARPAVLARARMPRQLSTGMRTWSAAVGGCRLVSCRRCGTAHPLHLCGAHKSGPQLAKHAHRMRRVLSWSVMVSLSLYLSISIAISFIAGLRPPPRPSLPTLAPLPPFHLHLPCIALPTNPIRIPCHALP
jgi:hypothetical protein